MLQEKTNLAHRVIQVGLAEEMKEVHQEKTNLAHGELEAQVWLVGLVWEKF